MAHYAWALILFFFVASQAQECTPNTLQVSLTDSSLTNIQIESGYVAIYEIDDSLTDWASISVVGGAKITYQNLTNTVVVGTVNPGGSTTSSSSFSSPSSPLTLLLAFFGLLFSIRSPKMAVIVAAVAFLGYIQIGHSACSKTVTIKVSEDYLHNVRVSSATTTINCPTDYGLVYDGQCVSWQSTFKLIYSDPNNAAACASLLPATQVIAADSNNIKTTTGGEAWKGYSYQYLNQYTQDMMLVADITLSSGVSANITVYTPHSNGQNHFPLSLFSGNTVCNATYICQSGSCLTDITDTNHNYWCGSWSSSVSVTSACPGNRNMTCSNVRGCNSMCEYQSSGGGSVTCNEPCDNTKLDSCFPLQCPCNGGTVSSSRRLSATTTLLLTFVFGIIMVLLF